MTGAPGAGGDVRRMHLAVQLPGAGGAAGAVEGADGGGGGRPTAALDFGAYARLARTAERGLFDFLLAAPAGRGPEPFTVLNALAGATESIGLALVTPPDRCGPDELARRIALLDRLSAGRAGGPVVACAAGFAPGPSAQGRPVLIREQGGTEPAEVVLAGARGLARPGAIVLARLDFTRGGAADFPALGEPGDRARPDDPRAAAAALALAVRLDAPVQSGALDGYVLLPDAAAGGRALDAFVELVVPLLQHRGSLRTAYRGTTLREHLGLPLPA
ncbi:LLM class flavin-dependent oxidoreductase [Streptomyces polygonati]|uniref:LLM class flavin-dependent oxidoreductase n=1 Tax=Streptomyces polygonati TaxID=1617087 RepID=A0ABV8HYK2_9ACTN